MRFSRSSACWSPDCGCLYAKLETTKDAPFYISQGDLKNAFYRLGMFEGLGEYFILPPIEAGAMGIMEVDGRPVGRRSSSPFASRSWPWAGRGHCTFARRCSRS